MLYNLASPRKFEQQLRVHFAHNTWQAEAHWRTVKPSQAGFIDNGTTVSAALGCVRGGFEQAVEALTHYRRAACIRLRADTLRPPVIFNDYMNCLEGDPTTAKELPLIDAAAAAGCEYYVIDAGWYAETE